MEPGPLPSCLEGMTQIEEMLIARACPIMTVYHKHGGQRGYDGHVLNLPQNIEEFITKLPLPVASLPILIVKCRGAENTTAEFRVRRQKVHDALSRLKQNNKFYHDIIICIDDIYAANLPQDGIPSDLQQLDTEEENSVPMPPQSPPSVFTDSSVSNEEAEICQTNSFLPLPQGVQLEEDGILQTINGCYALDCLN